MKRRVFYMHTIDDQPAQYSDQYGPYISFGAKRINRLATSLKELRKEQKLAAAERRRVRHMTTRKYGYVRIEVPE